jgi:hypothetical protein
MVISLLCLGGWELPYIFIYVFNYDFLV